MQSLCQAEHLHANDGNPTSERSAAYRVSRLSRLSRCFRLTQINNHRKKIKADTGHSGGEGRKPGCLLSVHSPTATQCCILFLILQLQDGAAFSIRDTTGVTKKDRIGSGPHTAHCSADADFMPLCSVFSGNNSCRRPHTPTSFCSRDKVAAIGPRGSALELASCRLGDDCQGPSRGRINSSCSLWRGARPSGALLRPVDKRPLEL